MSAPIHSVLETSLYVSDLDRAITFYQDVLGLRKMAAFPAGRGAAFQVGIGPSVLLLFRADLTLADEEFPPHGTRGPGHAAFRIEPDEIAAWRLRLQRYGVTIERELVFGDSPPSIYFRDPDGNSLELAVAGIWPLNPRPVDKRLKQSPVAPRTYRCDSPQNRFGGTMRSLRVIGFALLVLGIAILFAGRHVSAQGEQTLALVGGTVYPSPSDAPISNGAVILRGGVILAVGRAEKVRIPAGAKKIDCKGLFVTAGFQNSHVHFTEAKWDDAAKQPAAKLSQQLAGMLTRYGFTTVVDAASDLNNTVALRNRIQSWEITGPRILTAGYPLYPTGGTPFYLEDLPPAIVAYMKSNLEPATPEAATAIVDRDVAGSADIIKLFTGSLLTRSKVAPMDPRVAAAAVAEAHRHGRLVWAHPSNLQGLEIALNAGVDVSAHTTPMSGPWDDALVQKMKQHHMSLTPTLKLWIYEATRSGSTPAQAQAFANVGVAQLGRYERAGGQVLFGTDVGYMTDYDPTEEYVLMARAGLTPRQILATLTTAPAARFNESKFRGRIAPGMEGDIAVLGADPAQDARNFASVRYSIRHGRVIYPLPLN